MEACAVTALDAITAFAVPNPNTSSQSRRFLQVWLPVGLPFRADPLSLLRTGKSLIKPTLSAVDVSKPRELFASLQGTRLPGDSIAVDCAGEHGF